MRRLCTHLAVLLAFLMVFEFLGQGAVQAQPGQRPQPGRPNPPRPGNDPANTPRDPTPISTPDRNGEIHATVVFGPEDLKDSKSGSTTNNDTSAEKPSGVDGKIVAIIAGVVGGVVLLILLGVGFIILLRVVVVAMTSDDSKPSPRKRRRATSA